MGTTKVADALYAIAQQNCATLDFARGLGAKIPQVEFDRVWAWYHARLAEMGLVNRYGKMVTRASEGK